MTDPTWTSADWDAHFQERAAILEYDQGMTRAEAEAQAVRESYDQRINQVVSGIMGELAAADRQRRDPTMATEAEATFGHVRFPWGFGWVVGDGKSYRTAKREEPASAAFIVPAVSDGRVVDLVAQTFSLKGIHSRLGATAVVGADDIEAARSNGTPLYVFSTVPQWLKGGGIGTVIVNWQHAAYELDGVAEILCSASVADQLYTATRQCVPLPVIATPTGHEAHHAA